MNQKRALEKTAELDKLWNEWVASEEVGAIYNKCSPKTIAVMFVVFCLKKGFTL